MKKIKETDVKDSSGAIIITPGLKVRHKESQYEYTVDSVTQDDSGGIEVVLRLPDEPRFEPELPGTDIIRARGKGDSNIIYEIDPSALYYEPEPEDIQDDEVELISVPEKEFEKEYEVK